MRRLVEAIRQDVAYALRALGRSPALVATVVLTLGLGVGANAAVFTALDRVFFQPPPGLADPGSVRRLYAHEFAARGSSTIQERLTPFLATRDLIDLEGATRGRAQLAGYYLDRMTHLEPSGQSVRMTFVSPGFFDVVGVHPFRGRFFSADEDRVPGPPVPVAVISDAFWRNHFAADPDIIGKPVRVDETTYTVIGVASPAFEGLEVEVSDLWSPLSNTDAGGMVPSIRVIARLDRDADPRVVDQILTAQYRHAHIGDPKVADSSSILTAPILAARGPTLVGVTVRLIPGMSDRNLGLLARVAALALVVALIAIANVASLLLMRAVQRRREIAVRIALGISRTRLLCQLAIESVLLGALAAAAALLVAWLTGNALRARLASFAWSSTVIDRRVILFAATLATAGALAAGFAPAFFALRTDINAALKSAGGTRAGSWMRAALLIAQSSLCMALLACSGVFLQSLRRAQETDRGFDAERTIRLELPAYYASSEQDVSLVAQRLRTVPGVEAVGRPSIWADAIAISSKVGPTGSDTIGTSERGPSVELVGPELMRAAGFRLVAGRFPTVADNSAPIAVLNQSLARVLFPGQDAVGRCVHVREPNSPCRTVIGIVEDVRWDLSQPSLYRVYIPRAQAWVKTNPAFIPNFLIVRTTRPASAADVARLRGIVAPMISGGSDLAVQRMSDLLEPGLRPWRLAAVLFFILGILGLAAAATGIYGLIAYDVAQRSRELGVRIALGATGANIIRVVVSGGLRVVLIGVALGTVAAVLAGRVMGALLFDTAPYDPAVLVATALTLVVTAAAAGILPAVRAIRTDPVTVLASE